MTEITNEMWEKAIDLLRSKRNELRKLQEITDDNVREALIMDSLYCRYKYVNDRSAALYNAIMELR